MGLRASDGTQVSWADNAGLDPVRHAAEAGPVPGVSAPPGHHRIALFAPLM